jgi:hypothetical protein
MRKLLNNPWFVGSLCLAAPLLAGRALLRPAAGIDPARAVPAAGDEPVRITVGISPDEKGARAMDSAMQALPIPAVSRDPFAARSPGQTQAGPSETVHLSAVWTENGATTVLLNDRMLQAGDKIGRWRIESATAEGVWITRGRGRHFVALGETVSVNAAAAAEPL